MTSTIAFVTAKGSFGFRFPTAPPCSYYQGYLVADCARVSPDSYDFCWPNAVGHRVRTVIVLIFLIAHKSFRCCVPASRLPGPLELNLGLQGGNVDMKF